ncbi:Obg-like ATPase 1 [Nosema bombycis CQ1]|uniref:Obg-like ATPase homolog n=1 Tax=Nosema bombycis (strain CQ1 / CVCC 102059) TaxID=578461 RepID=R0M109_NOSB1|nr:Obg-like ATPase 1 [Nosema bombycis CQ1]|eukprot:EOB11714.1 Obg-like ATPase 1 [Nosema bombycis CQ1]
MKTVFTRSSKSNNLTVGIVGLPNTGKSTLFNYLTKNSVPAENYPFCTIDPSYGKVEIDDKRVEILTTLCKPKNTVKAYLGVTDIAGLVKGASDGVGLGNCFLDNIRNVDAIFHVVRCFEDPEILHVEDTVDPLRDINVVNDELRFKDIETLTKQYEKIKKDLRGKALDKKSKDKVALVERLLEILKTSWVNEHEFNEEEVAFISTLNLLTVKNVVYLANVSYEDYEKKKINKHLRSLLGLTKNVIVFSGSYLNSVGDARTPFLDKLVKKGYELLNLINFFTVGKDEVRSWTIRRGCLAPEAGSVIHTDFMNYFIMAEVMSYDDLVSCGSEVEAKKQGKYYQRGKGYVVNDGDIILFKHNPPTSKKKK